MPNSQLKGVVRYLRTAAARRQPAGLTDRQLLHGFAACGDQAAFAALVERHGPMVLRVCRRALRQEQDAEDAFQATFLVLARNAGSIRKAEALASWLHGVAHRVALRAKRDAGRRRAHEREASPMAAKSRGREAEWHEVQAALDEEIRALPEKYRAAFVLCFLEGKSRAEAARELGLKEGTVRSRLFEARNRLRERLCRRDIALPALLAVAALSEGAARAAPARLIHSTVRAASAAGRAGPTAAVSDRVAALAQGVSKAMSTSQLKTAVLCFLAAGLVAAGAGVAINANAFARPPRAPEGPAPAPAAAPRAASKPGRGAAIEDAGETVTFRGRVLGPDGKPLAGAEVTLWCHLGYWAAYRAWHPETAGPLRPKSLATTGKDGRFSATFRKSEVTESPLNMWERPWRLVQVVAAAKGYGPGWASLDGKDNEAELTLRLAKDDVAVKGRVLDLEGRPVVGAGVRVVRVGDDSISSLWQPSWAGLSTDCTTDRDGRFVLSGVGRGREVLLSIEGARIEHRLVTTATPAAGIGPEVEVVAKPTKPVEGTVRVKGDGKPLAGVVVYGEEEAHHRRVRAVTDARGHYRLVGLPKAGAYQISFYPPLETGCLSRSARVGDTEGLRPVTADVEVRRGPPVHVRLIDKVTRQPVRAELRYTPLEVNPLFSEAVEPGGYRPSREFQRSRVPDPDGVFRFAAYPGPGLLVVILQGHMGGYLPRPIDPADLARARGDFHMEWARLFGAYRLIDPKDGDKPLAVDIELDPGRKAAGSLLGPDGKPVRGATAYGLDRHFLLRGMDRLDGPGASLKADTFTASVLDPERPRTVSFVHKERKLIGHVALRGDEKGPVIVRMKAWGVLTGRLIDGDGKPVTGVRLGWSYSALPAPGMAPPAEPVTTDAAGRFRVEGLAPGLKFEITLRGGEKKATAFSAGEALKGLSLEPGQTKDLGDIRVTITPAPKRAKGGSDE